MAEVLSNQVKLDFPYGTDMPTQPTIANPAQNQLLV